MYVGGDRNENFDGILNVEVISQGEKDSKGVKVDLTVTQENAQGVIEIEIDSIYIAE